MFYKLLTVEILIVKVLNLSM